MNDENAKFFLNETRSVLYKFAADNKISRGDMGVQRILDSLSGVEACVNGVKVMLESCVVEFRKLQELESQVAAIRKLQESYLVKIRKLLG